MKNRVRNYAWGSHTALATLLGHPQPSIDPQAEMWIGAHPADPSMLYLADGERTLREVVDDDPTKVLGSEVANRFDGALPFLLKLLAAESPLSLQAHPTMAQAHVGFEAEQAAGIPIDAPNRNYKDRSHKPEMIYALTPFETLCGFRRTEESVRLLDDLAAPELDDVRSELTGRPGAAGLRSVVCGLLESERTAAAANVQAVADLCRARSTKDGRFALEYAMAARLSDHYPGDPGVLIALLMNRIDLAPGEAIYLPAGNMHAYLSGFGVEIMASSDNVLRGGLTTKHVDVAELSEIVVFEPLSPQRITPVPVGPDELAFRTPTPEFEFSVITVRPRGRSLSHVGPQVLLAIDGSATLTDAQGCRLTLSQGQSVFIPARRGQVWVQGTGSLVRARDGLLSTTGRSR